MALKNPVSLGKTASTFAFWRGGSKLLPMEIMLIGSVVTKRYSMAGIPRHFTTTATTGGLVWSLLRAKLVNMNTSLVVTIPLDGQVMTVELPSC